MSRPIDRLNDILTTFNTIRDALKLVRRCTRDEFEAGPEVQRRMLRGTGFTAAIPAVAQRRIVDAEDEADDYAVLQMWAVFELILLDFLLLRLRACFAHDAIAQAILFDLENAVKYIRAQELLELLKPAIDANLVGQVRQIKSYRDWVAHRNPERQPSVRTDAKTAHRILVRVLLLMEAL